MIRPTFKPYSRDTRRDALAVINAHLGGWAYARAVDDALLDYWASLGSLYQPEHMWLAYRGDQPTAFCHGQRTGNHHHLVHLLALAPGGTDDAVALLEFVERQCRAEGVEEIVGPSPAAGAFYGGYVLGAEPLHPHWATAGTDAYIRAGFRVALQGVLLVRAFDPATPIEVEAFPPGYQPEPQANRQEFDARAFGYHATIRGTKAAHCYARLYPHLHDAAGHPVGQLGNITTDEPHRGKGLARVMVQMCVRDLQQMGARACLIATSLDNLPALRAYEHAGFVRRHYAVVWSKDLVRRPSA